MSQSITFYAIFFAAIFTNNILLTNYLGMCSFRAVSREVKTSQGLGIAVVFVMAATSVLNWLAYQYILVPLDLVVEPPAPLTSVSDKVDAIIRALERKGYDVS